MATPLMLSPKECQGKTWHPPHDLSFAAGKVLLPLHAGEMGKAAATMPLAAIRDGRGWHLVAVCGLEPSHNLFIKGGQWLGHYRPQWLSTYPFSLLRMRERGVMIFERDSGLLAEDGSGTPFFTEEGELHPQVVKAMETLKASFGTQQATEQALTALHSAGVLVPWPEKLQHSIDMQVPGLHMVDEKALSQLDDAAFLNLRKAQALPIAYALNLSLPQTHLLARLARLNPGHVAAPENLDSFFDNDEDLSFDFDS